MHQTTVASPSAGTKTRRPQAICCVGGLTLKNFTQRWRFTMERASILGASMPTYPIISDLTHSIKMEYRKEAK